ncbi:MAG: bifunctional phosphoglucose/phosphomannose isomerase [Candidatus Spechtbacterales bacterium]
MSPDKQNMRQVILELPYQFTQGHERASGEGKKYAHKKFENIVIAGMGGSALSGEILQMLREELGLKVPVFINKDYNLPLEANKKSLIIISSYSGNTEETLSAYKEARKNKFHTAVITTGGKLRRAALKDKTPLVEIPAGVQPRLALGYQFGAILALCADAKLIRSQKKHLEYLTEYMEKNMKETEKKGRKLAEQVGTHVPVIYSTNKYRQIAYILKIQINENAKRHAFYNYFPELNHNEMVGYEKTKTKSFDIIMLKAKNDAKENVKRMELTKKLIKDRGYKVHDIDIKEKKMYDITFYTILLGLWFSYYLAIEGGVDPTPVNIVEEFKKELK